MKKPLSRRTFHQLAAAPLLAAPGLPALAAPAEASAPPARSTCVAAMRRAAVHMDQTVSYRGGYVWNVPTRPLITWGEMEARPTMCWIQPPGTPTMGHSSWTPTTPPATSSTTGPPSAPALALIEAQHPSGGWNYIHDFAGEESLRDWYDTIGATAGGWRSSSTTTATPPSTTPARRWRAQLLLRLYLESRDPRFKRSA